MKTMKLENWKRNSGVVRLFLDTLEDDNKKKQMLLGTLDIGDEQETDEMRTVYWTAIRNMGKGVENFPSFSGRPQESFTPEQIANLNLIANVVRSAYASIPTEMREVMLKVDIPHGKTGGEFADWEALTDEKIRKAESVMKTAIKEKRWDALAMNGDVPQITPRPVKEKAVSAEVSEEE